MLISALWLVSLLAPGTALAQAFSPNDAGVTMGHWHLNSVSVEANQKLLVGMGGTAIKPGDFNIVRFPGVAVFLAFASDRDGADRRHRRIGRKPRRFHRT